MLVADRFAQRIQRIAHIRAVRAQQPDAVVAVEQWYQLQFGGWRRGAGCACGLGDGDVGDDGVHAEQLPARIEHPTHDQPPAVMAQRQQALDVRTHTGSRLLAQRQRRVRHAPGRRLWFPIRRHQRNPIACIVLHPALNSRKRALTARGSSCNASGIRLPSRPSSRNRRAIAPMSNANTG